MARPPLVVSKLFFELLNYFLNFLLAPVPLGGVTICIYCYCCEKYCPVRTRAFLSEGETVREFFSCLDDVVCELSI